MQRTLWEAVSLVVLATLVALVFNAVNPKGIPLLRSQQRLPVVEDSVLQQLLQSAESQSDTSRHSGGGEEHASRLVAAAVRTDTSVSTTRRSASQTPDTKGSEATADHQAGQLSIRVVKYEHMLQLLRHPEVLLIDARRPEDYAAGHIPGARNIFAYDMEAHIPELLQLPRSKPIVIYCDGGQCELSRHLAEQLRNLGFRQLYIYEGGWEEWRRRQSN
ncbi:MAG: rhodanese-like domain-containing protein [Candidatus Kapabacteria bacterium]|nr:rhodanese-like domain-containing protein [Candidatus Kapabacteria bacterium]MDW8011844.1 rhodanese-like domain-containing protein [Bacteroidota bacterium]